MKPVSVEKYLKTIIQDAMDEAQKTPSTTKQITITMEAPFDYRKHTESFTLKPENSDNIVSSVTSTAKALIITENPAAHISWKIQGKTDNHTFFRGRSSEVLTKRPTAEPDPSASDQTSGSDDKPKPSS